MGLGGEVSRMKAREGVRGAWGGVSRIRVVVVLWLILVTIIDKPIELLSQRVLLFCVLTPPNTLLYL